MLAEKELARKYPNLIRRVRLRGASFRSMRQVEDFRNGISIELHPQSKIDTVDHPVRLGEHRITKFPMIENPMNLWQIFWASERIKNEQMKRKRAA